VSRTVDCTSQTRAGRLKKAKQFLETAEIIETMADDIDDVTDAYATLLVHAGVAASDVICCAALGVHAQGESHTAAVKLLAKVDSTLANDPAPCWQSIRRPATAQRRSARPNARGPSVRPDAWWTPRNSADTRRHRAVPVIPAERR